VGRDDDSGGLCGEAGKPKNIVSDQQRDTFDAGNKLRHGKRSQHGHGNKVRGVFNSHDTYCDDAFERIQRPSRITKTRIR